MRTRLHFLARLWIVSLVWLLNPQPELQSALVRGPYLQVGTSHSIVVRWRTDEPTDSRVRFGFAPDNLSWSAGQPLPTMEHVVVLTNLAGATTYYYAIGSNEGDLAGDAGFHFATAPTDATATRIWAIGDCGTASFGSGAPYAVRDAYQSFAAGERTDVWLMLGDNAYFSGTDSEYQAAVFDVFPQLLRTTPVWPTLGNHETYAPDPSGDLAYFKIFSLPTDGEAGGVASGTERYYSFTHGTIHFVCLDSELSDKTPGGPMATWLEQDLAASTADWIIAYWHSPPYSKGSHDSDVEANLVQMRASINPILEAYGVDLVLCGHSHSFERSYLLSGHYGPSTSLLPSMILNSGSGRSDQDGAYTKNASGGIGTVYVVAGNAGQTSGGSLDHPAMYLSLNQLGSMVIDIETNRLEAMFLRENGQIDDRFSIYKGPVAPLVVAGPQSQTAFEGDAVEFHVRASGSTPIAYQWHKDGQPVTQATNATLVLGNVRADHAGTYSVTLSNAYGFVISSPATLVVNPAPPRATWDLSRDFSVSSNPNGVWSYGYKTALAGMFGLNTLPQTAWSDNGVPMAVWSYQFNALPQVWYNRSPTTALSGAGVYPPGSVFYFAGNDGTTQNFGAIRLTVPLGADGDYHLETSVRPYVPNGGDTDYHVVKNGVTLADQFLSGNASGGYTNLVRLASGDTLDLLVGRGQDGTVFASGLMISARLFLENVSSNPPIIMTQPPHRIVWVGQSATFSVVVRGSGPLAFQWRKAEIDLAGATNSSLILSNIQPSDAGLYTVVVSNPYGAVTSANAALTVKQVPTPVVWDLSRDFSVSQNPAGVWSYGYKSAINGFFGRNTVRQTSAADNGVPLNIWSFQQNSLPQVFYNGTTSTATIGSSSYPPGSVFYFAGFNNTTQNFGAIRLTVPAGVTGQYIVESAVRPYITTGAGDTDFHVVRNGQELFGQFLAAGASAGYTNEVTLTEGQTLDFLVGRGQDGNVSASGLIINARVTPVSLITNPPTIVIQPTHQTVVTGDPVTLTLTATGTMPLLYQWQKDGQELIGATNASLSFTNTQFSDSGSYSASVWNAFGSVTSSIAILLVQPPPPPPTWDLSRDFSVSNNPSALWQYGYKTEIAGEFGLNPVRQSATSGNGVAMAVWSYQPGALPQVWYNPTTMTAMSGAGVYPPGSVYYFAGNNGSPQNYGAIRLTVPAGADGNYVLHSEVAPYVETGGGDTDYHVVHNGQPLAEQFLSGNSRGGYTNDIRLSTGDTVDFLVGRGADGNVFGSGLLISARFHFLSALSNPPVILTQPQSRTVTAGATVMLSVSAGGSPPLQYQWLKGTNPILGAGSSTFALDNVRLADAGEYIVLVQNPYGSITSTVASLVVNPAPSLLRLVSQSAPAGGLVEVPIEMEANGFENALGFSLEFDASIFRYEHVALATNLPPGSSLLENTNDAASGRVGFAIALPVGTSFTEHPHRLVLVTLSSRPVETPVTSPLRFVDTPTLRQIADPSAHVLPAIYVPGSVSLQRTDLEGDVAPRTSGDGIVGVVDWVQAGRFVAGLDAVASNEFQRIDCAPLTTRGDGHVGVTDWVQIGRYAVNLDPSVPVGGPDKPFTFASASGSLSFSPAAVSNRWFILTSGAAPSGSNIMVQLLLLGIGDENAAGLSIAFDPQRLRIAHVEPAPAFGVGHFYLNTNQPGTGRFGIIASMPAGKTFPPGVSELAGIAFQPLEPGFVTTNLRFVDSPIFPEISDTRARPLPFKSSAGQIIAGTPPGIWISVTRAGDTLFLSWPKWAQGFELYSTSAPDDSLWTRVQAPVLELSEQFVTPLQTPRQQEFYRLTKP